MTCWNILFTSAVQWRAIVGSTTTEEKFSLLSLPLKEAKPLAFETILDEVKQLHQASNRIEALANDHPHVSGDLVVIAGNVRNVATVLAVLVATKPRAAIGKGHSESV